MRKSTKALLVMIPVVAAILAPGGFAQAEEAQIAVRSVDTSRYPTTSLTVTLSGSEALQTQILQAENFALKENGKLISGLEVQPIAQNPEPVAVVLVLDASASMRGKPLEDAKAAAKSFINQMAAQDQIALIAFDSSPRVLSGLTTDKGALSGAVDGIKAQGETALFDSLISGVDLLAPGGFANKNVIVLSDGGDTKSRNSRDAVIQKAKTSSVPIFGIALQSPEYEPAGLQAICGNSGGSLLLTSDSGALSALYSKIAKELHNQYRITYTGGNLQTRKLDLELEVSASGWQGKTATVVSNPKYRAIPQPPKTRKEEPTHPAPGFFSPSRFLVGAILLSFLSASLFVFVLLSVFLPERTSLRQQMKFYDAAWRSRKDRQTGLRGSGEESRSSKIAEKVLGGVEFLARQRGFEEFIELKLEQASLPLRPLEFIFFHFVFVLTAGMVGSLFAANLVSILSLVVIATALPILVLSLLISRRRAKFHEQLPDTLTMIAGSIKAGYSFLQAISVAIDETLPPMSDEFKRVLAEARLGLPLEEALEKMAERVGEQNFTWTVMAINIQREVGGNLAEVLEILADTIRDRDTVKRQISSLTAEGRLSALILIILPFVMALLIFITSPLYMSVLFTTGPGWVMVFVASVLMLVGGFWLKRIVTIEV